MSDSAIQHEQFTPEELLYLISNVGEREALRRFAPSVTAVLVDSSGCVLGTARSKEMPSSDDMRCAHTAFPGSSYFVAKMGMCGEVSEIEVKLRRCAEALLVPPPRGGRETHTTPDGKTILVLGGPESKSRG